MAERGSPIFCIYLDFAGLKNCVSSLKAMGMGTGEISVLFPEWLLAKTFEGSVANVAENRHSRASGHTRQPPNALITGFLTSLTIVQTPTRGELTGALIGLGIRPYDAERYENRVKNGGILVSVRATRPELTGQLRELLCNTGAEDVSFVRATNHLLADPSLGQYAAHAGH